MLQGTRDTLVRGELVGGVALASDGTRLAASLTGVGRVVTFDLTDPGAPPFASAHVEQAQELSVAPGLFLAGARGAVAELSWRSGALVASIPITAGLKSPRVRTVQFGAGSRAALDVAATTFSALARRDASNLTSPGGLQWHGRLPGPALEQVVTLPGGGAVFLHLDGVGHGALRRSLPVTPFDGEREDQPGSYNFDYQLEYRPLLAASSDGMALFLSLLDSFGAEVRVFSTSGALKDPRVFGLGKGGLPVLQDGRGHFALLEAAKLRAFDTSLVLTGTTEPLAAFDLAGGATFAPAPLAGGGADGRFYLAMPTTDSFAGVSLRLAAPGADGTLALGDPLRFDRLNPDRQPTFAIALGGRRAYWIEGTGPTQRLVSVPLDLEIGEVLDEEQPVPLSGTASELVLLPDGLHAVVVDPVNDRLTLIE